MRSGGVGWEETNKIKMQNAEFSTICKLPHMQLGCFLIFMGHGEPPKEDRVYRNCLRRCSFLSSAQNQLREHREAGATEPNTKNIQPLGIWTQNSLDSSPLSYTC